MYFLNIYLIIIIMNSHYKCSIDVRIRNLVRNNFMKNKKMDIDEITNSIETIQTIKDNCDLLLSFPDGLEYVYILELENNKYYVGYTENFDSRMISHFGGNGSKWTKLHKPITVMEVSRGSKNDEDRKTIEMMVRYGYENVRGGRYCKCEMLKEPMIVSRIILERSFIVGTE